MTPVTDEQLTELNAASNRMRARERVFVDCPNCETRSFSYLVDTMYPGMSWPEGMAQSRADGWQSLTEHAGVIKKCEAHK